jgi:hypothetical protein
MKPWLILGVLIVALVTMGSSCINESFIIPVNVPLQKDFTTNPGGSWNDEVTFLIADEIPESLGDEVVGARLIDIEVWAENPPAEAVVQNGVVYVNGIVAATFSGTGAQFAAPVSLLNPGVPALIVKNQAGIDEIERVLNQFITDPENTSVTLRSTGTVVPAVASQKVWVKITLQTDLEGSNS